MVYFMQPFIVMNFVNYALREKCPNTEFFLVRIFLYSVQIQENTDQEKLHIWRLFTQWWLFVFLGMMNVVNMGLYLPLLLLMMTVGRWFTV